MTDYDVIVVGQGVVGSAAALGFSRQGRRVAIIDPSEPLRWSKERHDNRVFAISPASSLQLENLGVWESISRARISPYTAMEVWDEGGVGSLSLSARDANADFLGHIVESSLLCNCLEDALGDITRIPSAVSRITVDNSVQTGVALENGAELRCKLLVGADGGHSFVRNALEIGVQSRAYQQRGIVATVVTEKPHRDTAWQRFLSSGPLAFLPLSDGRSSIVWSADESTAARLCALSDAEFMSALSIAADGAFGRIQAIEGRASFPLRMQQAAKYVRGNAVLVGDAAHTIHPLAGLGVNLGLGDVSELLDRVKGCADLSVLPASALARYQRSRLSENIKLAFVTDSIDRLFSNRNQGLGLIRGQGMKFVGANQFLKTQLTKQALNL